LGPRGAAGVVAQKLQVTSVSVRIANLRKEPPLNSFWRRRRLPVARVGEQHIDEPISAELYSTERLEQHAENLARQQEVDPRPNSGVALHRRLRDNAAVLQNAYQTLVADSRIGKAFSPAAEWLVDNYYIVDEHVSAIRRDLPPGYYRQLPKLARGELRGCPRVYGLAWSLVAHSDSRFDLDTIYRFTRHYQQVQPLTIGELWAIAITMRVVLIENLRRLAAGIVYRRALRAEADALADLLLDENRVPAETKAARLAVFSGAPLPTAFAAQLFQRLRDHDPATTPALPWLHDRLASQGTSADEVVHTEHQRQGAINVSVRNVITSLKLISSVDWAEFVERVSLVDELMREQSHYASLDFPTRDLYRHAIEDLARGSGRPELEIARIALELGRRAGSEGRVRVPGYYLVADGRAELERAVGYRTPWNRGVAHATRAAGLKGYVGAIVFSSALLLLMVWSSLGMDARPPAVLVAALLTGLLLASEIAVALVNLWVTQLCSATVLPALEFADGVPAEYRTVIAVPTLLTNAADIEEQVQNLEVHYLASQDGDLRFALLSDWADAPTETLPDDAALLALAAAGIARLNATHGPIAGEDRFLLLHRRRVWNPAQGCWMGWERKRGKLHEFNRLLLGAETTTFLAAAGGRPAVPQGVRYVISLDADTRLPRGAVRQLIGKMAHPLNHPVIDAASQRVIAGYAILQPRVTPALPVSADASIFQSVFSGRAGIDPYAFAVSDVYQDLFAEGSYIGKGIYDVAAFEAALRGRVGENELLSHDLFEGTYARCGLASDVEVVEEYPSRYDLASLRQHRWTRGDWQLLPWIVGRRAGLPGLGRWKMLDNLRRSLIAPGAIVFLALVWSGPFAVAGTLFVLAALLLPAFLPLLLQLVPGDEPFGVANRLRAVRAEFAEAWNASALRLVFLADQAWLQTDAILRTLHRLMFSRRRLLEWTTAAQAKRALAPTQFGWYARMGGGLLATLLLATLVAFEAQPAAWVSAPFLLAFVLAPWVARRISVPDESKNAEPLAPEQRDALRRMARRTWSFFATFVTPEQHMLPPDNYQETPEPVVANRTSPTNIGLYLLAVVAAREFGWLGTHDAVERLEATFATLDRLERFRGHFFNWYDTHDLRPLDPRYVSTVDSGNFAGHLLALAESCRAWARERAKRALGPEWRRGILDTLIELEAAAEARGDERRNYGVSPGQLDEAFATMRAALRAPDGDPATVAARLEGLLLQAGNIGDITEALTQEHGEGADAPVLKQALALRALVAGHLRDQNADGDALALRLDALAERARGLALAMEFGFLVEPEKQLLTIGYRVAERMRDASCYDLLASEARLASYYAIAKGDLPVRHWFRLGRSLTPVGRGSALVSWSGSMFEYLMPELVMADPFGSVLGETARLIVQRQIDYGVDRSLPWGVSESAFNARDVELTYQYMSFGVPGLGLQRGLGDEAVIAPYATALAAMVEPAAALRNFAVLAELGASGRYGWYEALDFTPSRLPEGERVVIVRAYMAHHQGMTLVAIANVLMDGVFRRRFAAEPMIQANELLLQERTPRNASTATPRADEVLVAPQLRELAAAVPRRFSSPHHVAPRTHLLSNGSYTVMVTVAGSGFSRWQDQSVTRWREDATCDPWGSYVFLRDVTSGQVWSAGYQPIGAEPDSYEVSFFEDRAEITRQDGRITTSTEILVSPEDDAEVRRVTITNGSNRVREIELTSYMEIVLATPASDAAHPAFSKMFVSTEFVAEGGALLATRRTREPNEKKLWAAHVTALDGTGIGGLQYETDRARFLGRGRSLRDAVSIMDARPLSNTCGIVLDPVLSLRRRVRIAPGKSASVAFWTIVAGSRDQALALADKHRDAAAFERVRTLSWTQAQVQLRYLGVDFEEAQQFQRIANRVLYADPALRAPREMLGRNQSGQSVLWTYGISGDLPIVLIRIDDEHDLDIVKQLLRAHEYWQAKRLAVDLVILNDHPPSYAADLQHGIEAAIRTARTRVHDEDGPERGRVFLLRGDLMPIAHRDLLQVAARAILIARRGSLADQLARLREAEPVPRLNAVPVAAPTEVDGARSLPSLEFFNGLGGFAKDGREYVTILDERQWTPAPWSNIITNEHFGFQVSTDGTGSTWSQNSRENQLTPWSNDPVSNSPSEAIYIRDEQSGSLWSATPLPIRENSPYVVRHGFGYTRFEHTSHGIAVELLQFVPLDKPLKISRLTLVNRSKETRSLAVTHYVDWVLGNSRAKSAPFIVTDLDAATGALFARNPWNHDFAQRTAFMDMRGRQQSWLADRAEFLGRHGSLAEPAVLLAGNALGNRIGGGLDPCGALQTRLRLAPGESRELVLLLGEEAGPEAARALLLEYRQNDLDLVFRSVGEFWDATLGALQVKTPDRSMDVMLNGWLLYQTLACRVWARVAFYQASGAFGFRDQLQDVMALCIAQPAIARAQILRAAARQFEAGDVQHWWLPTTGQGVRTKISDDRIWLPFVVAHYLSVTRDAAVLDEAVSFLEGAPLAADQHESFGAPAPTRTQATLYEHCALALETSLAIGSHGLPLFGTGDWNDGMNRVGAAGKGESVWLAWFLHAALLGFAPVAEGRGQADRAAMWRKHAFAVQQSIEREAWDGDWYRRGYYDDGTPLGSVASDECRIDAIAQSWAVISGGGEPERAVRAMAAVNSQLVRPSDGLIELFTPAFDHSRQDPGYIKAYPPGLRENGGQYTHAAMWTTLAFALLGDGDMAGELFSLLNPINHASTRAGIHRYKVEPYVACADVYTAASHVGRGGWTWYTGSAGWMYRTAVEGILGVRAGGATLRIDPCIPRTWPRAQISLRHGNSLYVIAIENPRGVNRGVQQVLVDGKEPALAAGVEATPPPGGGAREIQLVDDGDTHAVRVILG
jgi:cyclic beta-1,2-glucan synthetase